MPRNRTPEPLLADRVARLVDDPNREFLQGLIVGHCYMSTAYTVWPGSGKPNLDFWAGLIACRLSWSGLLSTHARGQLLALVAFLDDLHPAELAATRLAHARLSATYPAYP